MKKLFGILLLLLFLISIVFSLTNELSSNGNMLNESPGYASILPIPPPPPPARRGC